MTSEHLGYALVQQLKLKQGPVWVCAWLVIISDREVFPSALGVVWVSFVLLTCSPRSVEHTLSMPILEGMMLRIQRPDCLPTGHGRGVLTTEHLDAGFGLRMHQCLFSLFTFLSYLWKQVTAQRQGLVSATPLFISCAFWFSCSLPCL